MFNTKGFQNTSVNDIMKKVGAVKGGFYYYFQNKEQVLDALVEQNINKIVNSVLEIVEDPSLNGFEKLKFMLSEEIKIDLQNNTPSSHLHNIKSVDMYQKLLTAMVTNLSPLTSKVIKQGVSEGLFKVNNPFEISEILIAGIYFISDLDILKLNKKQDIQNMKAVEELIEKSLCLNEGSCSFLSDLITDSKKGL